MPPRQRGPNVIRKRLGNELRRIREQSNMRLDEVAAELEVSPSKISRLETGRAVPKVWDVRNLLTLYDVQDDAITARLIKWANDGKAAGWWMRYSDSIRTDLEYYISLEAEAASIKSYCSPVIHGLLQTESYARAVLSELASGDAAATDERLAVRLGRQDVLTRPEDPVELHAVLDEAALRRVMGSPAVMRGQFDLLLNRAAMPNVTLQVFPFEAGAHQAMMSTFTIFEPREDIDPVVVNIESIKHDAYDEGPPLSDELQAAFTDLSRRSLDPAASEALIRKLVRAESR